MKQTGFFHHIGTFLLFVATVLLIITDISAPVVHDLSMLKVILANSGDSDLHPSVTFGTFGYCIQGASSDGGDFCSRSAVGYKISDIITQVDSEVSVSQYAADTSNALTKVMVLHPVATGLAFIAFLMALGAGVVGSFMAALVALLAFIVTLVVLITDFVSFSIIKSDVNNANNGGYAEYGAASWTILVAAIVEFIAMFVVFFTCCSARLHRRRNTSVKAERWDSPPAGARRRWF